MTEFHNDIQRRLDEACSLVFVSEDPEATKRYVLELLEQKRRTLELVSWKEDHSEPGTQN